MAPPRQSGSSSGLSVQAAVAFVLAFLGTFHLVSFLLAPGDLRDDPLDAAATSSDPFALSLASSLSAHSSLSSLRGGSLAHRKGGVSVSAGSHQDDDGATSGTGTGTGTGKGESTGGSSHSQGGGAGGSSDPSTSSSSSSGSSSQGVPAHLRFHTAMTCDSSGYSKWQSRVMFFYYKKFRDQPGSGMGGFTRVLHTGAPDELVLEIPTSIVEPLPASQLQGYVVLNRPYAFEQWIAKAQIEEEYVWMAEPDHLIVRPIPNLAQGDTPSAFSFFYIEPAKHEMILRKWFKDESRPITDIDPVGNSPVILKKGQLRELAPLWKKISMEMKSDADADKAFGWVLEMYAYATAAALVGMKHKLDKDWMIQPPWDTTLGNTYMIHYTYGCDFTLDGQVVIGKVGPWHFDKRDHGTSPPRNLSLPPAGSAESVVKLVSMINDATYSIPNWRAGVA